MLSVFISYARENRAQAASLAEALVQKGFKVWWDRDLVAGERFRETIRVQLEQAQRVIVLWSKASVTSDFVIDEAGEADKSRKLVPNLNRWHKSSIRFPKHSYSFLGSTHAIGW
jgi:adenylate cyclase